MQIHVEGQPPVSFGGSLARIVTELAGEVWGAAESDEALRNKLDKATYKLRRRLQKHGLRTDLVKSLGAGEIELLLQAGDEVIDEA